MTDVTMRICRCHYCGTFADPADVEMGIAPDDCCWKGPEWGTYALVPVDEIEKGRQWEAVARRLATYLNISDICGPRPGIGELRDESRAALAAFRELADPS